MVLFTALHYLSRLRLCRALLVTVAASVRAALVVISDSNASSHRASGTGDFHPLFIMNCKRGPDAMAR